MAVQKRRRITLPLALAIVALAVVDAASGDSATTPATEPPPSIRIRIPEDQAMLRSGSFEISGDFAGSATEIEVFADGELLGPALRGEEAFDWRLPASDVSLEPGLHRISAVATGEGGPGDTFIWVYVDADSLFEIALVPAEATYEPDEPDDDPRLLLLGNDVDLTLEAFGVPGVLVDVNRELPTGATVDLQVNVVTVTPGVYPVSVRAEAPDGTVREATHTITILGPAPTTATTATTVPTTQAPGAGPSATLFDDFEGADLWTSTVTFTTNGSTATAVLAGGGNPGGQRRMTHVMPGTDDGDNNPTQISVLHLYTGGGWDPASDGALSHVDYSEDQIEFDPPFDGAAIGTRFVVMQDGSTYSAAINEGNAYSNTDWRTARVVMLTPGDFLPAPGPDFSADGAPLTFGYSRSNTSRGGRPITLQHGIDNWTVALFAE